MGRKLQQSELSRLLVAMQNARRDLTYPRECRQFAVKQYVGMHYAENGPQFTVPVNLIARFVSILSHHLVASNPKAMLSTFERQNMATIDAMEQWVNDEIERQGLATILQRWVVDALFSMGIVKVGIASEAEAAIGGYQIEKGDPFVRLVDLDDWVHDTNAHDLSQCNFMGHRFRVPLEVVLDSKLYSASAKAHLQATINPIFNADGDERVDSLSRRGVQTLDGEYKPSVDLWSVYLPQERKVLTLTDDQLGVATGSGGHGYVEPLREENYIGPPCGPYILLGFGVVPGNSMPKAPIQDLIDTHMWVNKLARKLHDQSVNQKSVLLVSNQSQSDAQQIGEARDGAIKACERPEGVVERGFRGPNQSVLAMFMQAEEMFNEQGGNLRTLGGLANQAPTATQEKLLAAQSSATVSAMQAKVSTGATEVVKALCWYWHHHPKKEMRSLFSLQAAPEFARPRVVTAAQRQNIEWDDLRVKVDVYSMNPTSPMQQLMSIQQFLAAVQPFMGAAMQQGIMPDFNELFSTWAKYANLPEIKQLFTTTEPAHEGAADAEQGGMPAQTSRTYNRTSSSEATEPGQKRMAITSLMGKDTGGNPYESERNGTY